MALPVTISDIGLGLQNSYHGPFKSSGGNFYTISRDGTSTAIMRAFKATDPTDSFAQVDNSTGSPSASGAIVSTNVIQDSDALHVVCQDSTEDVWYFRFDMSSDTWDDIATLNDDVLIDGAPNGTADACDIAVLSAAYGVGSAFVKIRVVYQGATDMDMGSAFERIDESNSVDDGENWSAATQIDNGASVAGLHYTGPRIVKHPSDDQCFIFMTDETNLIQRAIAGDDTLRTYRDTGVNLTVSGNDYPITHGLGFTRSSTAIIRIGYHSSSSGNLHALEFDAFTDDTDRAETDSLIGTALGSNNESSVACLAVDGSIIRGLMEKGATNDLHEFFDDDADSYTLEGTEHLAGTVNHVSCNVYDRSGTKLAMIYDDAGTVKYDEIALTTTIAVLSGIDLAQQNLFHGPFEI